MVFTNAGAQYVAWMLGGSVSTYLDYIEIGYGSGTPMVTNSTLVAGSIRASVTDGASYPSQRIIGFQGDFPSNQISGLTLREFGLFSESGLNVGSAWQRESFNGVTFDGTSELQVYSTVEVIPR